MRVKRLFHSFLSVAVIATFLAGIGVALAPSASATTTSADVSVVKTAPATAPAGSELTYTITVTLSANASGTTRLTDTIPAQTTFLRITGPGGGFNCSSPAVGSTGTETLFAQVEHWDGSHWRIVRSPDLHTTSSVLDAVAAVTPRDVWAVGQVFNQWCYFYRLN